MESWPIGNSLTEELHSVLVKKHNTWVIFENQVICGIAHLELKASM